MEDLYFLWIGPRSGKNSFTWAEIGFLLKEYWWFWLFGVLLFLPSFYRFYQLYKGNGAAEDLPVSERMELQAEKPMEEVPSEYRKGNFFTKLNLGLTLFVVGVILTTTRVSINDVLLLLIVLALLIAAGVMMSLPKEWVYRSFDEEADRKQIDWCGVKRFLLPYATALAAGLVVGIFFVSK